jgi:DNA adenine methylase
MSRQPSPVYVNGHHRALPGMEDVARSRRNRIVFGWYGGKFSHLGWLLPLLPECHHYCEPYAGSAAVLLNRAPSAVETYNDIDGEVVNFFRVLRDDRQALIEAIGLTPFSREEFYRAVQAPSDCDSAVVRAAKRKAKAPSPWS